MRGGQFLHWIKYHLSLDAAATQTTDAERRALRFYARGCRHLVEIGVFEGVTSLVLREAMDSTGTLTGVDPFFHGALGISYGFSISQREVQKSQNGSVHFLRKMSDEAAKNWSLPVDFIFFDGDHSEAGITRDWSDWSPHIISGGFAAFHDSIASEGTPGPPALVRSIQKTGQDFHLVCQVDSLTVFQRHREDEP